MAIYPHSSIAYAWLNAATNIRFDFGREGSCFSRLASRKNVIHAVFTPHESLLPLLLLPLCVGTSHSPCYTAARDLFGTRVLIRIPSNPRVHVQAAIYLAYSE